MKKFTDKHPLLGWQFTGLQRTGLFRNWPLIYQCRTEFQCSGCSDSRFRGWYASSVSGPKGKVAAPPPRSITPVCLLLSHSLGTRASELEHSSRKKNSNSM